MKTGYVYILASRKKGTLYVGVTSDLKKRVWEHKAKVVNGFSEKYGVDRLVYYEVWDEMKNASAREKQLKAGNRQRKLDLIQAFNPEWVDLYQDICS